ncbi:BA75_02101T0 [Komagataella pastoris]|uniref:peptidyl-tRNA hydrolase n=1 Tax=Komagataella pastoris TaxID=4922 RepID=A0A1B2JC48_PICPA|nr:BA75_02101T0 [Komagataella pastoris]
MSDRVHLIGISALSLFTGACLGALWVLNSPSLGTKSYTSGSAKSSPKSKCQTPASSDYLSDFEHTSGESSFDEVDDESVELAEEEEYLEIDSKPLNEIPGECKMVFAIRQDLKMEKGKVAAQCCHAAVSLYRMMFQGEVSKNLDLLKRWESLGQAKITLKCPNQDEMDLLYAKAISLNVNAYIVHDAGRTQIAAGSATVLGLGPAPNSVLDQITGNLKLY